jgi:type I restriction enzyme S subunit
MNANWPLVRLGDYCLKIGSGATPKGGKSVYLDAGQIALIRSQNVYNDTFKPDGLAYITVDAANKLKNVEVQSGDILLNITGDSVARLCLAPDEYLPARVNQHVAIIRPDPNEFDSRFLRYFLTSPKQQELLLVIASAGATRNALTKSHIESLEVCKPELAVQIWIATQLESLDKKIQINHQINQTLEHMAQALFKSWFVDFEPIKAKIAVLEAGGSQEDATLAAMTAISGKDTDALVVFERKYPEQYAELKATAELFPSAMQDSELGDIPEGWELGKLQDLLVLQRGFDLPASSRTEGYFPLIAASGPSGTHNVAMAKAPGVVTGRSGVLGNVFLTLEDYWPLNTTLWVKEFKRATPCFAYELLRLLDLKAFNAGSAVPSLNRNHIHSLNYPLPPMALVNPFESTALLLHQHAHANAKQSQTLAILRDTLLPKLLSGEMTLPEAEQAVDEVENV